MSTGKTIAEALAAGNISEMATAMQLLGGSMLEYVEADVLATAPSATHEIEEPLLFILGVRVTAAGGGTGATGERMIGDSGATPGTTYVAATRQTTGNQISWLLTFEGTLTAFTYCGIRFAAQPPKALFDILAAAAAGTALLDLPVERA